MTRSYKQICEAVNDLDSFVPEKGSETAVVRAALSSDSMLLDAVVSWFTTHPRKTARETRLRFPWAGKDDSAAGGLKRVTRLVMSEKGMDDVGFLEFDRTGFSRDLMPQAAEALPKLSAQATALECAPDERPSEPDHLRDLLRLAIEKELYDVARTIMEKL